jgi:hypothetical protein
MHLYEFIIQRYIHILKNYKYRRRRERKKWKWLCNDLKKYYLKQRIIIFIKKSRNSNKD